MGVYFGMKSITGTLLASVAALLLAPAHGSAQSGSESTVGYIDSAIPLSQFRLRYDSAYDSNRPSRAEFFYPKSSLFNLAPFNDPRARGPAKPEKRIDYQDLSSYMEWAVSKSFSGFIEAPVRFTNPTVNPDASGFSDLQLGFKWAVIADPDRYVTFQMRTFVPTGAADKALGTGHVSVEPSLLLYQRLNHWLVLEGEVGDWIPIGGSDFAGNVTHYGVGLGATVYEDTRIRVTPVTELLGWTVLNGRESVAPFPTTRSAAGDTIINLKAGVRLNVGTNTNFYIGYGRALTGDVWYKDIVRVEFRRSF